MLKKILLWLRKKYSECFFVGSTDKLPPPLSKEKELEYLIKVRSEERRVGKEGASMSRSRWSPYH